MLPMHGTRLGPNLVPVLSLDHQGGLTLSTFYISSSKVSHTLCQLAGIHSYPPPFRHPIETFSCFSL